MNKIKILDNFFTKDIFLRFPTVFIFIFSTIILAISYNHHFYFFGKILHSNFLLSSIFLIFISTAIHMFFHKNQISLFYKILTWSFAFLAVYLSIFLYTQTAPLFFFSIILFLFSSSFLFKKPTNEEFLAFILFFIFTLSFALLSSAILFAGIEAIMLSLDYLFNIKISHHLHRDIQILIFPIVFSILSLSAVIKYNYSNNNNDISNNLFKILLKNILSPLIFIYALILYVYIIKITILQDLPKGNLSIIICVFLSIGILFKILLVEVKDHNILSGLLDKYFIYLMVIPIVFLYIAIYTRVEQYGLTPFRYLLVACALWFTYLFLYEVVKKEFNIKSALISLLLLSLFASITPFNINDLSIKSQIYRLKNIFIKNNMYINNKVIPTKVELEKNTRINITLTLKYLVNKKEGITALEELFGKDIYDLSSTLKYINVKYSSNNNYYTRKYVKKFDINNVAISSKGYDYSSIIKFSKKNNTVNFDNKSFTYYIKNSILNIKIKNQLFQFDLKSIVQKLQKEKIEYINYKNYKKAIFYLEHKDIKIKLFISSLFIIGNNDLNIYSGNGILFLKIK